MSIFLIQKINCKNIIMIIKSFFYYCHYYKYLILMKAIFYIVIYNIIDKN